MSTLNYDRLHQLEDLFRKKISEVILVKVRDKRFKDIAFVLQYSLEKVLLDMSQWAYEETGINNSMFAGGVHMNCKANGVIIKSKILQLSYNFLLIK